MCYPPTAKGNPTSRKNDKIKLAKHRSLPELYLQTRFRLVSGSGHCIYDDEGLGKPSAEQRARHASMRIWPHDGQQGSTYLAATKDCTNSELFRRPGATTVVTATPQKAAGDLQPQVITDARDPDPSVSRPSSVDRSPPMTAVKPSRSLKASRRNLVIGLDTKKASLNLDNDHHDIFKDILASDEVRAKSFTTLSPTLRRRRRLSIGRTSSNPEAGSVKPIAISLTFSSPATPQNLSPRVSISEATFDALSSPNPAEIPGPTQVHGSPERRVSASLSSPPSTPSSASASFHAPVPLNVRLGHPSRPYYSAIRKQGISPPSPRRSSIKGAIISPSRPKSYPSPSPFPPPKNAAPSAAQRHLSFSAVSHTSSILSAFSLDDDSDYNADEEELPVIPLTPVHVSGRMSFGTSLASAAKSLSRKRSMSGPSRLSTGTTNSKPSHSTSSPLVFPLSTAHSGSVKKSGFRMSAPTAGSGASGIGFSVSGETELKMALAFSEAQTTKNDVDHNGGVSFTPFTTPAIQEEDAAYGSTEQSPLHLPASASSSPISPPSSLQLPIHSNPRKSIAKRVRKLRQGLKDMLLMTTGNNTNSTTTTTTTAT